MVEKVHSLMKRKGVVLTIEGFVISATLQVLVPVFASKRGRGDEPSDTEMDGGSSVSE